MKHFSIGILSWHSTDVLIQTLTSYHDNGLLQLSNDITIWFQEFNATDKQIADHFGLKYIESKENVGIGKAFLKLAEKAKNEYILLLEHDFQLVTDIHTTNKRINQSLHLLDWGYDCVRLRHRKNPGYPHFSSRNYMNPEQALSYHDPEIDATSPHLLDAMHWCEEPDKMYKGKIGKQLCDEDVYYSATSKYANFTNNPCIYRKDFYINTIKPFVGDGIELEGKISYFWNRSLYNIVQGEGIFSHNDWIKYGVR